MVVAHGGGDDGDGIFHIFIIYKNLQKMTSQISIGVVYLQEHQRDTSEFKLIGCLGFSFLKARQFSQLFQFHYQYKIFSPGINMLHHALINRNSPPH